MEINIKNYDLSSLLGYRRLSYIVMFVLSSNVCFCYGEICMKGMCVCLCVFQGGCNFGFGLAYVCVLPTHCESGLNQSEKVKKRRRKKPRNIKETKMDSFFTQLKTSE